MYRPGISEDVKEKVEELTADDFNVPEEKVSFEDRVRVLAEKYEELEKMRNQQNINFR